MGLGLGHGVGLAHGGRILTGGVPTAGLLAAWDPNDLTAGAVASWAVNAGSSGAALAQATSGKRPTCVASVLAGRNGVTFTNLGASFLQAAFAVPKPYQLHLVYRINGGNPTTGVSDAVADGVTVASTMLGTDTGPQTYLYGGPGGYPVTGSILGNGSFVQIVATFNGASSSLRVARGATTVTGNTGATASGGLTLGALGGGTRSSNLTVAYVALCDTATLNTVVENYIQSLFPSLA